MDKAHLLNVTFERLRDRIGQYRHPVLAPLAAAHDDLPSLESMHTQPQAFEQTQTGAIKQARHQPLGSESCLSRFTTSVSVRTTGSQGRSRSRTSR